MTDEALRSRHEKKAVPGFFEFRILKEERCVREFLKLRYDVWTKLEYIAPERLSSSGLEIDEYDAISVPIGGFHVSDGQKRLVCGARIITGEEDPERKRMLEEIVTHHGDGTLRASFEAQRRFPLIIMEDYAREISAFVGATRPGGRIVEFSRLVCSPEYHGAGLAPKIAQLVQSYGRFFAKADLGFVICWVNHVKFNTEKLGFDGQIPGISSTRCDRVRINESTGLYIDLHKFDGSVDQQLSSPPAKAPAENPLQKSDDHFVNYIRQVHSIRDNLDRRGNFCYCSERKDCDGKGYESCKTRWNHGRK